MKPFVLPSAFAAKSMVDRSGLDSYFQNMKNNIALVARCRWLASSFVAVVLMLASLPVEAGRRCSETPHRSDCPRRWRVHSAMVRRLAAHDSSIDIVSVDVVFTAEFANVRVLGALLRLAQLLDVVKLALEEIVCFYQLQQA